MNANPSSSTQPQRAAHTVAAVYPDRVSARQAINDLRAYGLRKDQLGVAMRDGAQQARLLSDADIAAAAGAQHGAATQNAAGGGWRAMAAGIRGMLGGGTPAPVETGAVTGPGGMIGVMIGMNIPEAQARQQEATYRAGSVMVTARVYGGMADLHVIMERHGGILVPPGQSAAA